MDSHKDNKRTDIINFHDKGTSSNTSNNKSLINKPLYELVNKKTEKLVTALYMVTDCMDTDDALKSKIRLLGVELLSDIYKLPNLSPVEKSPQISLTLSHINEVLSLIEISCTIGFISEMNTAILKRELLVLISELEVNQSKDNHFTFTLDEEMFNLPVTQNKELHGNTFIKDKRTLLQMSFRNRKDTSNLSLNKGLHMRVPNPINKQERSNKILSFIKDLTAQVGKKEVSIKDISVTFNDCSEKTIQRELNLLVSKGQIGKIGSKRWSKYYAI